MQTKKLPPPSPPPSVETRARPRVAFDWQDWLPYLAASDASEADKRKLIETVWAIVVTFVDHGWEVGSTPKTCGQDLDLTAALTAAMVRSDDTHDEKEPL